MSDESAETENEVLRTRLRELESQLEQANKRLRLLVDVGTAPSDTPEQSLVEQATYGSCHSRGEKQALRAEEHLCNGCFHTQVCVVANTVEPREGMMLVIYRCLAYLSAEEILSDRG